MSREEKDEFGTRIKGYEQESEIYLDKTKYTIIRVDGHGFSKFTKGFEKPFDEYLSYIMSETARAIMEEVKCVVAYTQSDEITLIIKPGNLIYSGRVQKLASLIESFAAMKFNTLLYAHYNGLKNHFNLKTSDSAFMQNITDYINDDFVPLLGSKLGKAFFDARVFQVPSETEAFNALLWRVHDCKKNSISVFAQSICSHKELQNKNGKEMIEMCLEKGHDYNLIKDKYKYGIIWKKELYIKEVEQNNTLVTCQRTRFKNFSFDLKYSEENVDFILCDKLYKGTL